MGIVVDGDKQLGFTENERFATNYNQFLGIDGGGPIHGDHQAIHDSLGLSDNDLPIILGYHSRPYEGIRGMTMNSVW